MASFAIDAAIDWKYDSYSEPAASFEEMSC